MPEPLSRADAMTLGVKRYYTGAPCKRGHIVERHVSDWQCIACKDAKSDPEYQRAWRAKNADRVREGNIAYRVKFAADIAKQRQGKYRATKDQVLSDRRAYYADNKGAVIQRVKRYRDANRETIRLKGIAYYRANLLMRRSSSTFHRCKRRGAPGKHTARDIGRIGVMQRHKCAVCRVSLKDGFHADHIVPIARGGSNAASNIQLLCATCNLRKSARDPIEFMQSQGFLL